MQKHERFCEKVHLFKAKLKSLGYFLPKLLFLTLFAYILVYTNYDSDDRY
jgi:hypothetical protein